MTGNREEMLALAARLRALAEKASPGPWAYRPQEHDDWGMIRTTVATADGWYPVVARAKDVGSQTEQDLHRHRRNNTDPTSGNAELIVEAVNALPVLIDALTVAAGKDGA